MTVEPRGRSIKEKETRPEIELWEYLQYLEHRWSINICEINQGMC